MKIIFASAKLRIKKTVAGYEATVYVKFLLKIIY